MHEGVELLSLRAENPAELTRALSGAEEVDAECPIVKLVLAM
jgi:hypothetical protein